MMHLMPARALVLIVCALVALHLGGCSYTGCCDWGCGDDYGDSGFERVFVRAVKPELFVRGTPMESFRIDGIDLRTIPGLKYQSDEALRGVIESANRQVIIDTKMVEVSDGFMDEIGVDAFTNGFSITSNYANGASNEQFFAPNGNGAFGNLDLIRYSQRSGRWMTQTMSQPSVITTDQPRSSIVTEQDDTPSVADEGIRTVRWLDPGLVLQPPSDGNVIVMIPPVRTWNETTDGESANDNPLNLPRVDPRNIETEVRVPDNGTVLVGGLRRNLGDGERGRGPRVPRISLDLYGGYTGISAPRVGTGTHIVDGNEGFLVQSPEFVHGYNIGGRFSLPIARFMDQTIDRDIPESPRQRRVERDAAAYLFLDGSFTDVSGDDSVLVEAGGDVTAYTVPTLADPLAMTGVGFGMLGAEGTMTLDIEEWDIELGGGWNYYVCGCCCTRLSFEPYLNISGSETVYDGTTRIVSFPDNFARVMQEIDTTNVGLGFRTTVNHRLSRKASIFATANLGGYYYDADGHQMTTATFPLLAAPLDFYEIAQDASTDGVGFKGGLEFGFNYRITRNLNLSAYAGFEYMSDQAYFKNPENPAQPASFMDTDDALRTYVGVNVSYRF